MKLAFLPLYFLEVQEVFCKIKGVLGHSCVFLFCKNGHRDMEYKRNCVYRDVVSNGSRPLKLKEIKTK
jgi:hypothetical protein